MTDNELIDILNKDYTNTVFTSKLYEMFGKDIELVVAYIKEGRKFWYYDTETGRYRRLIITYIRTGVMFFVFEDESEIEYAWFIRSFNASRLYAAQIYPYEIAELLSKHYPETSKDFPDICRQCKWENCYGNITVDVIWD